MKDDYNTNSHYLDYTFLFEELGEWTFPNLGVKGLEDLRCQYQAQFGDFFLGTF